MMDHKDSCSGDCIILKSIDKSEQSDSPAGIEISVEILSTHIISVLKIPILTNTDRFDHIEYPFIQVLKLNKSTPPPEKIS